MRNILSRIGTAGLRLDDTPELKLVIAYESFADGLCALRFLEKLLQDFGRLFTFVPRFLKFEQLLQPEVAARTSAEAAAADMVIVATSEGTELPALIKKWISQWDAQPGEAHSDGALVALLSSARACRDGLTPIRSYLCRLAERTGRKFLCHQIEWAKTEMAFPVEIKRVNHSAERHMWRAALSAALSDTPAQRSFAAAI